MDGKNRLLAVKGPDGRIEARRIMRFLWDGSQPVLFLERLYSNVGNLKYDEAVIKMAKEKAGELGVPLTIQISGGEPYPSTLRALGGPVPFEYVDALQGVQSRGFFTMPAVEYIS